MISDNDTNSYFYLINMYHGQARPFVDIMRPPLYPLLLLLSSIIDGGKLIHAVFIIQTLLMTLTFVFLFASIKKLVHGNSIITLALLFPCAIFYPSLYTINRLSPDALLIMGIAVFLYLSLSVRQKPLYMIPLVLSLTMLSFIKPIFLYFPIVILGFYLFLTVSKFISVKNLLWFFSFLLLFYAVPVFLWSYGNKIQNGYFTFSNITELNLIGKLMQYHMADRGAAVSDHFPIQRWLTEYQGIDPYDFINRAERVYHLSGEADRLFEYTLYRYAHEVLWNNSLEFGYKSIKLLPIVITRIDHFFQYSCHTITQANSLMDNSFACRAVVSSYNHLFLAIIKPLLFPLFILSTINVIRHVWQLIRKKTTLYSFAYLLMYLLVFYFICMAAWGQYLYDYQRILVPIYFELLILCGMTIYDWILLIVYLSQTPYKMVSWSRLKQKIFYADKKTSISGHRRRRIHR